MKRSDVLRVAVGFFIPAFFSSSAGAEDEVRVRIPQGIDVADTTSERAPDGGIYVTVSGLIIPNPSMLPQSYGPADFHLVAAGTRYMPIVRPRLGAIDAIERGIVGPGEPLKISVSFHLPAGTSTADFEFTPHWLDDSGRTIDYCCLYL